MPESATDIIEPEVQGELDTLSLLVEETDGSVIAFVRYRTVAEREAGVRYLKEQLSLPVEERVLSEERTNPLALLESVPDERRCVQFYDLEAALPEVTGSLNVNREAYADVPHALVFWVGEHGLREVATNAPDFWAWRSGVFDVRSDELELSQSMSQVALADDVQFTDRGDLERRTELYEGLIEEYEGEDEKYVAHLRLKLFAVAFRLRHLEQAEEETHRLKAYAEQENADEWEAQAYHQLGMIAQERRDFEEAEDWYHKSVEINERRDDEHGVAKTHHQLGIVAQQRREFKEAEQWYRESVGISEHLGDDHMAAKTYHNLGVVAQERHEFEEAEEWLRKSVVIKERLGDERGAAKTYHQLGRLAQERRNLEEAEKWYRRSVEIEERLGDEQGAAKSYHHLGKVARERRDLEEAEDWYRKSVEISEHLGDDHMAATTYGQWGQLARDRGDFQEAGAWSLRALRTFRSGNDLRSAGKAAFQFGIIFDEAPLDVQDELRQQWIDAGLPSAQLDEVIEQIRAEEGN